MGQADKGHGKGRRLKAFFALVYTGKMILQESQVPENRGEVCSKEDLPSVEEDLIREYLNAVKSIESNGMHSGVLRGLASVIAELLAIIFERLCQMLLVSEDWRTLNVTPVFRKGRNEDR